MRPGWGSRPFFAVYPRLTGGPPARMFDFAPDEACRFPVKPENGFEFCQRQNGPVSRKAGIFPALSPMPRWAFTPPFHPYLTTKNANKIVHKNQCLAFLVVRRYIFCGAVCLHFWIPGVTRHHALRSPDFPPPVRLPANLRRQPGSSLTHFTPQNQCLSSLPLLLRRQALRLPFRQGLKESLCPRC